jgi:thiamine pyrophosphokinase
VRLTRVRLPRGGSDFDSIRSDVLDFYRERGCTIAFDPDPNSTDFDKVRRRVARMVAPVARRRRRAGGGGRWRHRTAVRAWRVRCNRRGTLAAACSSSPTRDTRFGGPQALKIVEEAQAAERRTSATCAVRRRWTVVAFGAFGDRFDHELASINVLHRYTKFARLILMGERMTASLLMPGRHVLRPNALIEGPTCGLLPIGAGCDAVWTSGLRWNLRGEPLRFGGTISSSNQMLGDAATGGIAPVTVTTTHPLVWTTVLRPEGWPSGNDDKR